MRLHFYSSAITPGGILQNCVVKVVYNNYPRGIFLLAISAVWRDLNRRKILIGIFTMETKSPIAPEIGVVLPYTLPKGIVLPCFIQLQSGLKDWGRSYYIIHS